MHSLYVRTKPTNKYDMPSVIALLLFAHHCLPFVDRNECKIENGGCSQKCVNTFGSFSCECADGFKLSEDGKKCIREFSVMFLLYS